MESIRDGSEPRGLESDLGKHCTGHRKGMDEVGDQRRKEVGGGDEWSLLYASREGRWSIEVGKRSGVGGEAVGMDGGAIERERVLVDDDY